MTKADKLFEAYTANLEDGGKLAQGLSFRSGVVCVQQSGLHLGSCGLSSAEAYALGLWLVDMFGPGPKFVWEHSLRLAPTPSLQAGERRENLIGTELFMHLWPDKNCSVYNYICGDGSLIGTYGSCSAAKRAAEQYAVEKGYL